MTRYKDFGRGSAVSLEPVSFTLHGETFDCVTQIQGKLLLDLIKDSASDDVAVSTEIITKFFSYVLKEESYARFEKLLDDKERIVTVDTLSDITTWLIEEYTSRPEKEPEDS